MVGGSGGLCTQYTNQNYGTTNGSNGEVKFNLNLPFSNVAAFISIDSLRFTAQSISCNTYQFNGLVYPANSNITSWLWDFGDGVTNTQQNPIHQYNLTGTYNVKLKILTNNNCTDSFTSVINVIGFTTSVTPTQNICHGKSKQLIATGGSNYSWSPSTFLSNTTIPNPTCTPTSNITYYVTITNAAECNKLDSVKINYLPTPNFSLITSKAELCSGDSVSLVATGGNIYNWTSSAALLNNATTPNVFAFVNNSSNINVQIINSVCNDTVQLNKQIIAYPIPQVSITKSSDVNCAIRSATLTAYGATNYTWYSNSNFENINNNIAIDAPSNNQVYNVIGSSNFGCIDTASISINFTNQGNADFYIPNIFTPNGDGVNDCFGIQNTQGIQLVFFEVYNRWGQKVFSAKHINDCWNGKIKNNHVQNEAYVYHLKLNIPNCGTIYKKGTIIAAK